MNSIQEIKRRIKRVIDIEKGITQREIDEYNQKKHDVVALKYEILDNDDERVTIEYEHGGSRVVNVSMDSGVAMIRDIMRAID